MSDLSNDPFEAKTRSFLDWTTAHNISISNKIKIEDLRSQGAGRGVIATADLSEDEALFSIPRTSILTPETSDLPADIRAQITDSWLALILAMLYEHAQGPTSKWKAYLDVLPDTFDTLMFWSDEQLSYLRGCAVVNKIGKAKANQTFLTTIIPVVRQHPTAFLHLSQLSDEHLVSICHQMGSAVMAYAFDIEKPGKSEEDDVDEDGWEEDHEEVLPIGMVPMADMLNADADRNNAKLYYEAEQVVMRTIKPVSAGEEIFNDYGALPNADLARRYGYTTYNYAQYDVVEFDQALLNHAVQSICSMSRDDIQQRLEYLETQMSVDAFTIARLNAEEGQFSIELLVAVRCLVMSRPDFEKMKAKEGMPSERSLKPEEHHAVEILHKMVQDRVLEYSQEHEMAGTDETTSRRQTMGRMIRQGEMTVLSEANAELKRYIDERSANNSQAKHEPQGRAHKKTKR